MEDNHSYKKAKTSWLWTKSLGYVALATTAIFASAITIYYYYPKVTKETGNQKKIDEKSILLVFFQTCIDRFHREKTPLFEERKKLIDQKHNPMKVSQSIISKCNELIENIQHVVSQEMNVSMEKIHLYLSKFQNDSEISAIVNSLQDLQSEFLPSAQELNDVKIDSIYSKENILKFMSELMILIEKEKISVNQEAQQFNIDDNGREYIASCILERKISDLKEQLLNQYKMDDSQLSLAVYKYSQDTEFQTKLNHIITE